jgi:hypothetical protein
MSDGETIQELHDRLTKAANKSFGEGTLLAWHAVDVAGRHILHMRAEQTLMEELKENHEANERKKAFFKKQTTGVMKR